MKTISIAPYHVDLFKKEFAKLVKLSAKMNMPAPTYTMSEKYSALKKIVTQADGEIFEQEYFIDLINIDMDIEATYKFSGWNLVGVVFFKEGGIVLNDVNSIYPTELGLNYYTCDHCGGNRENRDKSFILKSDSGDFKQVGSTCVKKFLGYSPDAILNLQQQLNVFDQIGSMGEGEPSGSGRGPRNIEGLLAFDSKLALDYCCYQIIKDSKFIKKEYVGEGRDRKQTNSSTATMSVINDLIDEKVIVPEVTKEYRNELISYINSLEVVKRNIYDEEGVVTGSYIDKDNITNKIKSLIESEKVKRMDIFVFALAVNMFEKSKIVSNSKHIGVIGEKVQICATITDIKTGSGMFGDWIMYNLKDNEGNLYTKFGVISEEHTLDGTIAEGSVVNAIFTVKDHKTFNNNQITVMGRLSKIKTPKTKK